MSNGNENLKKQMSKSIDDIDTILLDNPSTIEVHYAAFQAVIQALKMAYVRIDNLEKLVNP